MATTIKLKNGSGAPLAGDLVQGEPALDLTNKRLYTEDSGGTVIEVGTNPTSLTTGTFTSTGIDDNATSTAITIDSDGDVGIGVSPAFTAGGSRKLLQIANSTNGAQIAMSNSSSESENPRIFSDSTNLGFATAATGSGAFQFYTAGTERMSIDSSGNVGIGLASPLFQAADRTAVTINGTTSSNLVFGVGGSANTYFLADSSGFTVGNTSATLPTMFYTNGAERMRISSAGDVQIGTAAVTGGRYFDIYNTGSTATDFAITRFITQQVGSSSTTSADIIKRKNGQFGIINNDTDSAAYINFTVGTTERMHINSSGNVGIGTSSPTGALTVSRSSSDSQINLIRTSSNTANGWIWANSNKIRFGDDSGGAPNNTRMCITTDTGRVGIGTSNPSYKLDVDVGAPGSSDQLLGRFSAQAGTRSIAFVWDDSASTLGIGTQTNHPIAFHINGSSAEKMRLDTSGRVCIGTTSGTELLNVAAGSGSGAGVEFAGNGTTVGTTSLFVGQGTANEAYVYQRANSYMVFATNSTERMRITASGQLVVPVMYSDTTSDAANVNVRSDGLIRRSTSSRRYKNDITDATHGLTELLALRSVTYKGNNDGDRIFGGLIAEEVHEAGLTEFVQYDSEGNPDALAYGHMIALCVKAIQELTARVTELEGA